MTANDPTTYALEDRHWPKVLELFDLIGVDANIDVEVLAAGAGWAYERKGYLSVDTLGNPRNPTYSGATDDAVLSVTIRISRADAEEIGLLKLEQAILAEQEQSLQDVVTAARLTLQDAEQRLADVQGRMTQ